MDKSGLISHKHRVSDTLHRGYRDGIYRTWVHVWWDWGGVYFARTNGFDRIDKFRSFNCRLEGNLEAAVCLAQWEMSKCGQKIPKSFLQPLPYWDLEGGGIVFRPQYRDIQPSEASFRESVYENSKRPCQEKKTGDPSPPGNKGQKDDRRAVRKVKMAIKKETCKDYVWLVAVAGIRFVVYLPENAKADRLCDTL